MLTGLAMLTPGDAAASCSIPHRGGSASAGPPVGGAGGEGMLGKWGDLLGLAQTATAAEGWRAHRCSESNARQDIYIYILYIYKSVYIFFLSYHNIPSSPGVYSGPATWSSCPGVGTTEATDRWLRAMAMALDAVWLRVKNVCRQNGLLIMSVLAVVIGCLLGFFLRTRRLTEQVSSRDLLLTVLTPVKPMWCDQGLLHGGGGRVL